MALYVKLFEDTLKSSIWAEDSDTRIVWLTLLMMSDKDGFVRSTAPGIAHFARVQLDVTEKALHIFESPDPNSRTLENDGKRVERVEGGYQILNYSYYRDMKNREHERELTRRRVMRYKERQKVKAASNAAVTQGNEQKRHTDTDTYTDAVKEQADLVKQIMKLYAQIKPPGLDTTRGRGKQHVIKLSKKHKLKVLLRAVQNYKTMCEANNAEQMYRRGIGNFFGRDRDWEEYASRDWKLEESSGGKPERVICR